MNRVVTGIGELYEGDVHLGAVRYHITYGHREHVVKTMGAHTQTVQGLGHVDGTLESIGEKPDLWDLLNRGASLTLKFGDGGIWECFLQSSDGTAVNRGQFQPGE